MNQKKLGQQAARKWLKNTQPDIQVELAGCRMQFGETLDDLIGDDLPVPPSSDPYFSWGFYKQVKGHVVHKLWSSKRPVVGEGS
jgi:hypothetical protein